MSTCLEHNRVDRRVVVVFHTITGCFKMMISVIVDDIQPFHYIHLLVWLRSLLIRLNAMLVVGAL
jgi:hypothetical protein